MLKPPNKSWPQFRIAVKGYAGKYRKLNMYYMYIYYIISIMLYIRMILSYMYI